MFFFFNVTAAPEIYTLSLHDALPILLSAGADSRASLAGALPGAVPATGEPLDLPDSPGGDRKSTRLNSSHSQISYAVFCLKKKKKPTTPASHSRTHHPAPIRLTALVR